MLTRREEYGQIVDYIYEKTQYRFSTNPFAESNLSSAIYKRFREGAVYEDFTASIDKQLHLLVGDKHKDRNRIVAFFSRKNFWRDL